MRISKLGQIALWTAIAAAATARGQEVAPDAAFVQSILDDQAIAIGIADVGKLDVAKQLEQLKQMTGDADLVDDAAGGIIAMTAALRDAGIRQVAMAVSLADLPRGKPLFAFRIQPNGDFDAAEKAILSLKPAGADASPLARAMLHRREWGFLVADKASVERLAAAKRSSRAGLEAALTSLGNAELRILVLPTEDVKRVLTELAPTLAGGDERAQRGAALGRGVHWIAIGVRSEGNGIAVQCHIQANDGDSARQTQSYLAAVLKSLANWVSTQPQAGKIAKTIEALQPTVQADRVVLKMDSTSTPALSSGIGESIGQMRASAMRMQSMNHLKQILLAAHIYHDAHKGFPAQAIRSPDGKPLLSWRVAVLPYLEQKKLYDRFRLDEPWDSEHNAKLAREMPPVYANPASKARREGKTCYLGVAGPEGIFAASSVKINEITDGTSNTIAVVEVEDARAVPWTKPDDLQIEAGKAIEGLGGHFARVFLAGFADGSVQVLETALPQAKLRAFMTKSGGEVIER